MAEATHYYPLTKMNFLVTVADFGGGSAAFSEVTGVDSNVDVIEFRQGNAASLAPIKIPGLVKHGNITLKYGITKDSEFKNWIMQCVDERRDAINRQTVTIELMDITEGSPKMVHQTTQANHMVWILSNAWVAKYVGPDLNASTSEVAIETVEIAYEELIIPNAGSAG
jgi:phage tail-like protein